MKAKIHTPISLISLSGLSFGQTVIYTNLPNRIQDDFIVFISELYSYKEVKLAIEPIEPTDTIQFQCEKYQLKYTEIEEKKLGLDDLLTDHLGNFITDNPRGVSCFSSSFGKDYFVIDFFKEPELIKHKLAGEIGLLHTSTAYYYEKIKQTL
jgi:hypothetical protein